MPESPTESARAQGAPDEPPIGTPIYDEVKRSAEDKSPDESKSSANRTVVTPQTAGSAGTAHKEG